VRAGSRARSALRAAPRRASLDPQDRAKGRPCGGAYLQHGPVSSANGPTFTLVGDAATATAWMGRLTKSGATDRVFQVYAVCA